MVALVFRLEDLARDARQEVALEEEHEPLALGAPVGGQSSGGQERHLLADGRVHLPEVPSHQILHVDRCLGPTYAQHQLTKAIPRAGGSKATIRIQPPSRVELGPGLYRARLGLAVLKQFLSKGDKPFSLDQFLDGARLFLFQSCVASRRRRCFFSMLGGSQLGPGGEQQIVALSHVYR